MSEELKYSVPESLMRHIFLALIDADERLDRKGIHNIRYCLDELQNKWHLADEYLPVADRIGTQFEGMPVEGGQDEN